MKQKFIKNNSGQSVIELLIAVLILSLVLTTATLMATKSIQLSEVTQNREKAILFAKNAIEEVRKQRDTQNWNEFAIDEITTEFLEEVFNRKIAKTVNGSSVDVLVEITWTDFKGDHTLDQSISLTRWR
jgi:Tfp pilus assembly protein PilV